MKPAKFRNFAVPLTAKLSFWLVAYSLLCAFALYPWIFNGTAQLSPFLWLCVMSAVVVVPGLAVHAWMKRVEANEVQRLSHWAWLPKRLQAPSASAHFTPVLRAICALKGALLRQQLVHRANTVAHVLVNRQSGRVVFANRAAIEVFATGRASLMGEHFSKYFHDWELLRAYEQGFKKHGIVRHIQVQIGNAINGERRWYYADAKEVFLKGEACVSVTLYDISGLKSDIALTKENVYKDRQSGSVNERELRIRIQRALYSAHARKATHTLCHFEFQILGDSLKTQSVCELLKQRLVGVFLGEMRIRDSLALLESGAMICLLEHCDLDEAQMVIHHIKSAVEQEEFEVNGKVKHIGLRVGAVVINRACTSVDNILEVAADDCAHAPALQVEPSGERFDYLYSLNRYTELGWVERIQQALLEGHFQLYLAPLKINTKRHKNHRRMACEVLIRLKDELGELIMPQTFMPIAERFKLSSQIDIWMFERFSDVLAQSASQLGKYEFFALNLSIQSLLDEKVCQRLVKVFRKHQSQQLCIQLPESKVIANIFSVEGNLNDLKSAGCTVALSGFGAGLTSYTYLKRLPIDVIKVDGQFIKGAEDDNVDYTLVRSINEVCQAMGCITVADRVESSAARAVVENIGIDYLQGYAIGQPMALNYAVERSKANNL